MRELDLLKHIFLANPRLDGQAVPIPPGDDMGSVLIGGQELLLTVDQIADSVHFDLASTPLDKIARKAITRNLSDVAAMAAVPVAALAAAMLPRDLGQQRAEILFDALRSSADHYRCPLIGGDIAIWDRPLVLTVTILARPGDVAPIRRSAARPGQAIFVTGELGGSTVNIDGHVHHLDFEPRLELAQQLAKRLGREGVFPGAMIDLSDGLATDLRHVCQASNVRAELWPDHLPISPAAQVASTLPPGRPSWQHALADGEDYELCFTAPPEVAMDLTELAGVRLTQIGRTLPPGPDPIITLKWSDGRSEPLTLHGWEHHAS